MKGDFSRWTAPNAAARHYAGVLMQQGRLHTDADWNEQLQIALARGERVLGDIIGQAGTPKGDNGFRISTGAGGFRIAAGHYYLDGALVQNDAPVSYDDQGGDVAVPPLDDAAADGADVIVYLEASRIHVTGREDPRLLDPALSGVDTATRIKAAWRVAVEPVTLSAAVRDALIEVARCGGVPDLPGWSASTGRMSAQTPPAGNLPDDSDCKIPPEAGYLSTENQLYRVEILTGGTRGESRFVWSRENGSVEATLARNTDGEFILQGTIDDEALGFVSGNWVEVYDAADTFNARSGVLRQITLTDEVVTFSDSIGDFTQMVRPRVRRWDQTGDFPDGLELSTAPIELERGIEVAFTNGDYRSGDYWVFEARTATGNIIWPQYPTDDPADPVPPMGWGFRRAPLALARISGNGLSNVTDLRAEYPSLTCLQAEDIRYDDSQCNMGAETVQQALDMLCQRTSTGLCTFVVSNTQELVAAIDQLQPRQSARICLRGGNFPLSRALRFEGLGHITVEGVGPQSVVAVSETEPAMLFRNCATVRVIDLSVNGGPTGIDGQFRQEGRLGALTMLNCGDVSIERVRGRCRAGLDRTTACISTQGGRVLVRDCLLKVGQSQIGIQVINARRAVIENNVIITVKIGGDIVRRRVLADPVLVAKLRRSVLDFGGRHFPGNVNVDGTSVPLHQLFSGKEPGAVETGRVSVDLHTEPEVARVVSRAIGLNRRDRVSTPKELRQQLINIVESAIRDPGGRAIVGGRRRSILTRSRFAITQTATMAQGITVAGAEVEDVSVLGNRIEGANDGIRIAASARDDPSTPVWMDDRPDNTVIRARIEGNMIALNPLATTTDMHGVLLGHVDNASVSQNDIAADVPTSDPDRPSPHFGIYQYGYRGPRLTITENTVTKVFHGFAIVPTLSKRPSRIWRLRDNAVPECIVPYVLAEGVTRD